MPTVVLQKILEFTHAFFPKDRFDKVVEKNGWIFGKKGNGYIALYSSAQTKWQDTGEYKDQELIAQGRKNIWITEMGREDVDGSFDEFIKKIAEAQISVKGLNVKYLSPSVGLVETGWRKGLKVDNKNISTKDYQRYDNPACNTEFESDRIEISYNGKKHILNYNKG